jgi:TIR domain
VSAASSGRFVFPWLRAGPGGIQRARAAEIFISYRRADSGAAAGRLRDRLAGIFGAQNVFMDVDSIPGGVDFAADLNRQVAACRVFLAIIGPNWLDEKDESGVLRLNDPNDLLTREIAAALARDTSLITVIPVLVGDARMPRADQLPDPIKRLAERNAVEVRNAHFARDADALAATVRDALGRERAWAGWRRVATGGRGGGRAGSGQFGCIFSDVGVAAAWG